MDSSETFINRKHGKEAIGYATPQLEKILKVTYGCIVYQEQVMQICRELAGYSYARADLVRRAMSKKKEDVMRAERANFKDGCAKHGIAADTADEIFDVMVGFAKYAFNKSHATAYGIISYRTAYLKAHYPAEYYAALMTSVLSYTQKLREYMVDAQKMGVSVLPPDINRSSSDFSASGESIRFGLLAIKNVGRQFTDALVRERANGLYKSLDEFLRRLGGADINKRTIESFIKAGVFDSLGVPRSALLACYENIIESEHEKKRNNISGQMDFFSLGAAVSSSSDYEYPKIEEFSKKELLILEKESSGMYFSGHLIDAFSAHIAKEAPDKISEIISDASQGDASARYKDGCSVKLAGIITAKKTKALKNGDTMAFLQLDDKYGEIEIIVFAKQYVKFSELLAEDAAVIVEGKISVEDNEECKILLSKVTPLLNDSELTKSAPMEHKPPQRLFIKLSELSESKLLPVYRIAGLNPGKTPVIIFDDVTKKYINIKNVTLEPTERVLRRLADNYGEGNVILK
jgi:DNA polymerase-3 subunit alpha